MSPRITESKTGCIEKAMTVIGEKWTALILRSLSEAPKRFNALVAEIPRLNPRTLSQRLKKLEQEGVITAGSCPSSPNRQEYSLTAKGEDLLPIIQSMADWGAKHS